MQYNNIKGQIGEGQKVDSQSGKTRLEKAEWEVYSGRAR